MKNIDTEKNIMKERVAKVLSRAGLCSRREAERWISEGKVKINNILIDTPAIKVSKDDKILVNNIEIPEPPKIRIWRFHKPKGCLVTNYDPKGRTTIFDILPKSLPRVISVGRLDYESEGLILLTNDGETSRKLELPSTGWLRRYKVRVHGYVNSSELDKLKGGIKLSNFKTGPIEASLKIQKGSNAWILIGLRENHIKYADFTSTIDDTKHPGLDFDIQGKQWFFGGGLIF